MSNLTNKKIIFILGPGSSGKGTQAKLLAEKFGFFYFMTSKIAKDYIETNQDEESLKQWKFYKKGILFNPKWIIKIVKEKTKDILNSDDYNGIVYDGSPRTLYEAKELAEFLSGLINKNNIKIIEIKISGGELKKRLEKRIVCNINRDHVFISSNEIIVGSFCPQNDGGILIKREDDSFFVFNTRMEEYNKKTLPALNFLKDNFKVIISINGEQSIKQVFNDIVNKLETNRIR